MSKDLWSLTSYFNYQTYGDSNQAGMNWEMKQYGNLSGRGHFPLSIIRILCWTGFSLLLDMTMAGPTSDIRQNCIDKQQWFQNRGWTFRIHSTVGMYVLCRGVAEWTLWVPYWDPLQCCMCFYRDPNYIYFESWKLIATTFWWQNSIALW